MKAIIFNHELAKLIQELQECTIEELRDAYLPRNPGYIDGKTVSFEPDLKHLEELGSIRIDGENIKFIHYPTPPRSFV